MVTNPWGEMKTNKNWQLPPMTAEQQWRENELKRLGYSNRGDIVNCPKCASEGCRLCENTGVIYP